MHVAEKLITGMTDVFRSPYGADQEQQKRALKEYYDALSDYSKNVLDETWLRLRIRHTKTNWPLPAEIAEIASEVASEEHIKETQNINLKAAYRTPQGKHALENGTGIRFKAACQKLGWVIGMELTERLVRQTRFECGGFDAERLQAHQDRERECREEYGG